MNTKIDRFEFCSPGILHDCLPIPGFDGFFVHRAGWQGGIYQVYPSTHKNPALRSRVRRLEPKHKGGSCYTVAMRPSSSILDIPWRKPKWVSKSCDALYREACHVNRFSADDSIRCPHCGHPLEVEPPVVD